MKPKGLGRGLDALLSDDAPRGDSPLREIPLADIDPNRDQPRKAFDAATLRQLADSIERSGVLQPIIVCPMNGRYRIVAGERRWRAARLAGLSSIPAIIRESDAVGRMEMALVENLQREDLNPVEEAAAIRALMDECGLTQESVAQRLGRSRPSIANLLRILALPGRVQEWVAQGALSAGHARTLAGVDNEAKQIELAQRAIDEGWSVRALEQEASRKESPPQRRAEPRTPPPEFERLASSARETFGMRVAISGTLKRGRIVLRYDNPDELERFNNLLEGMRE
ncbi:MAG: ParB/RepB/Spo0J family partition protein [Oscillospiraceae bacterium]|jgi:ParB family chromosome partitioning protein|nr:ParB/RepB/Spo0J family partition protein [Oscillospiraceae bacterium]